MHYLDLLMNSRTLRMADDTAALHHRYFLTLAAVMVLEWPGINALLPASLRLRGISDAGIDARENCVAELSRYMSRHSHWLDWQFRDFPAYLRDWAINDAIGPICYVRIQRLSDKPPLIDFLTNTFRGLPEVHIRMDRAKANEIAKNSFRKELKLFDRGSQTWMWRRIVPINDNGIPYNGQSSVDEGEEMIKVSRQNAEMCGASMGTSVTLRSAKPISMQSILDAIPLSALDIPESFWTLE